MLANYTVFVFPLGESFSSVDKQTELKSPMSRSRRNTEKQEKGKMNTGVSLRIYLLFIATLVLAD